MPVYCHPLRDRFDNQFELEVFETLCDSLEDSPEIYQVVGPLFIPGTNREIDGLVISPYCVFTVEAKGYEGEIYKEINSDIRVLTLDGKDEEFLDRYEKPYQQIQNQWKTFKDFLRREFGNDGIWVKPTLVFRTGSVFYVPEDYRDFYNAELPFIGTPEELSLLVQTLKPSRGVRLIFNLQNEIVDLIKENITVAYERSYTREPATAEWASPNPWDDFLSNLFTSRKQPRGSRAFEGSRSFSFVRFCLLPLGVILVFWICLVMSCISAVISYIEDLLNRIF